MHIRSWIITAALVLLTCFVFLTQLPANAQKVVSQAEVDFQKLVPFYKKLNELGCNASIDRTVLNVDLSMDQLTETGEFRSDVFAVMKKVPAMGRITVSGAGVISNAGIAQLKELKPPRGLDLRYAPDVTDEGVKLLANMIQLRYLDLGGSQVSDRGLKHLSNLTNLEVLDLRSCDNIRGAGLAHVATLPKLRELNLDWGALTDEVGDVRGFSHLKVLNFQRQCKLSNKGFASLEHMVELEKLDMAETHVGESLFPVGSVDDQVLSYMRGLVKMKQLSIDYPIATDQGLKHLSNMTQMESLSISHSSNITGVGLVHLERMTKLERLYI